MSKTIDSYKTHCTCGHLMARHYPSALMGMERGDAPACRDCACRTFVMRDATAEEVAEK